MEIGRFAFLRPPGNLRATYDDHLRHILKRVVYFLLALIERFSLGVTSEVLRAIIGWKSAISLQRGPVDPKFQTNRQTNARHYITSLADTGLQQHWSLHQFHLVVKCLKCVFTNTTTRWDHTPDVVRTEVSASELTFSPMSPAKLHSPQILAASISNNTHVHKANWLRTYCILYFTEKTTAGIFIKVLLLHLERGKRNEVKRNGGKRNGGNKMGEMKWGKMQMQVQNQ